LESQVRKYGPFVKLRAGSEVPAPDNCGLLVNLLAIQAALNDFPKDGGGCVKDSTDLGWIAVSSIKQRLHAGP
jgi:hypothetical protein